MRMAPGEKSVSAPGEFLVAALSGDLRLRPARPLRSGCGGKGLVHLEVTLKFGSDMGIPGMGEDDLLIVIVSGRFIRIKTAQVRALGRSTRGVRLINLEEKDRVVTVAKTSESEQPPGERSFYAF